MSCAGQCRPSRRDRRGASCGTPARSRPVRSPAARTHCSASSSGRRAAAAHRPATARDPGAEQRCGRQRDAAASRASPRRSEAMRCRCGSTVITRVEQAGQQAADDALADRLAGREGDVLPHVGQVGRRPASAARAPSSRAPCGRPAAARTSLSLGCCRPRSSTTRGGSAGGSRSRDLAVGKAVRARPKRAARSPARAPAPAPAALSSSKASSIALPVRIRRRCRAARSRAAVRRPRRRESRCRLRALRRAKSRSASKRACTRYSGWPAATASPSRAQQVDAGAGHLRRAGQPRDARQPQVVDGADHAVGAAPARRSASAPGGAAARRAGPAHR